MFIDSLALFGSGPNQSTTLQLSKLYAQTVSSSRSILNIESLSVQQQSGHLDCGVFAIANAVEVCLGTNPEKVQYKQDAMRAHLEKCLYARIFSSFPHGSTRTEMLPRPSRTLHKIKLYCICRMPEEYDDKMVCCDSCHNWFHVTCVVSPAPLPDVWECNLCRKREA